MGRSRPLAFETVMAVSLVVVASLVALVVVFRHGGDPEELQAVAGSSGTSISDDGAGGAVVTTTTTAPTSSTTTTAPEPRTSTPTTTTTLPSTSQPSPAVPAEVEPPAPDTTADPPSACGGLVSESYWAETGDRSRLAAAAGGSAEYVEVVTNEGDQPCTLSINRCGTTAELRTTDGERVAHGRRGCSSEQREEVLDPDEERTEQLRVDLPVPPGDYVAHVRRYDGTTVDLPVTLDDRLPPCPADVLELRPDGEEQFRQGGEVNEDGFALGLIVAGAPGSCTVRIVETSLGLDVDGEQAITVVDDTDRWLAAPVEEDVLTHMFVPPTDIPAARYEGVVTGVLEDGSELVAPLLLLIG